MRCHNAQSSNTSPGHRAGAIPHTGPSDQHYYRYTDQLAKDSSWRDRQVVSDLPA